MKRRAITALANLFSRYFVRRSKYDALEAAYAQLQRTNAEFARKNIALVAQLSALDPAGLRANKKLLEISK